MRNQILEDLKSAMKAQDKLKLSVIRMVKSSIQMEELNKKRELTDDEVIDVISKQIKTRKESIAEFEKAGKNFENLCQKPRCHSGDEVVVCDQILHGVLSFSVILFFSCQQPFCQ